MNQLVDAPSPHPLPSTPREMVEALIRLDTTSVSGNRPAIDLLAAAFTAAGAEVHVLEEADPKNANLVAVFPANASADGTDVVDEATDSAPVHDIGRAGPGLFTDAEDPTRRGMLIAGHADCVPVTGQQWTSPPFSPTERDGRLYGRGSADMKSYLAIAAALAPEIASARRTQPVYVAATWEEESTADGARALVRQLDELGIRPAVAFVGEPTSMQAVSAHKSTNLMEVEFRGIAAHSSLLPRGVNAIRWAAAFTQWYHEHVVDAFRTEGPFDDAYPVPWTTGGVNTVEGGVAINTVPDRVRMKLEFRALPFVDELTVIEQIRAQVEEFDAQMRAAVPADPADPVAAEQVGASFRLISNLYGLDGSPDGHAARAAVLLGAEATTGKVTYGTEAGIYEKAGMQALVVGPGDIAQAHGADEYVALDQLAWCERWMREIIRAVG